MAPVPGPVFISGKVHWMSMVGEVGTTYDSVRRVVQAHCDAGRHSTALRVLDRAIETLGETLDHDPGDVALFHNDKGAIYMDLEEWEMSEESLKAGIEYLEGHDLLRGYEHGKLLQNLGSLYFRMERYDDAERVLGEAIDVDTQFGVERYEDVAMVTGLLGVAVSKRGEYERSSTILRQAIERMSWLGEEGDMNFMGFCHNVLGTNSYQVRDFASAIEHLETALAYYQGVLPRVHPRFSEALYNLSVAREARGELEEAETAVLDALERAGSREDADPEDLERFKGQLREVRRQRGDVRGTLEAQERRTAMLAADPSTDPHVLLDSYVELAETPLTYRSFKVAFMTLREAAGVAYQRLGPDHERTRELQREVQERSSRL